MNQGILRELSRVWEGTGGDMSKVKALLSDAVRAVGSAAPADPYPTMLLYGREVGRDEEMIGELTAFNHGFVVLDTTVAGVTSEVFRPLSGLIKKLTNGDIFLHSIVLPNYVFFHIYTPGSREAKLFPGYPVLCYWQVGSGHGEVYGRFGIEAARWNGEDGLKAWFDRWLP